jgi:hypothetical protein
MNGDDKNKDDDGIPLVVDGVLRGDDCGETATATTVGVQATTATVSTDAAATAAATQTTADTAETGRNSAGQSHATRAQPPPPTRRGRRRSEAVSSADSTAPASTRQDGSPDARSREPSLPPLNNIAAIEAYLRRNISMPRMARRDQGTGAEVAAPTESVADDGDGSGDVSFDADLSGRSATEFPADEQQ